MGLPRRLRRTVMIGAGREGLVKERNPGAVRSDRNAESRSSAMVSRGAVEGAVMSEPAVTRDSYGLL